MDKKVFSIGASSYKLSSNESQEYIDNISKKILENYNQYANISKFTETEKYIFASFNLADQYMKASNELSSIQDTYNNQIIDLKLNVDELSQKNSELSDNLKDREDKIVLLVSELDETTKLMESNESDLNIIIEEKNNIINVHNGEREKLLKQFKEEKEALIKGFANEKDKFLQEKQKIEENHNKDILAVRKNADKENSEKIDAALMKQKKEIADLQSNYDKRYNLLMKDKEDLTAKYKLQIKEIEEKYRKEYLDKVNEHKRNLDKDLKNKIGSYEEKIKKLENDKLAIADDYDEKIKGMLAEKTIEYEKKYQLIKEESTNDLEKCLDERLNQIETLHKNEIAVIKREQEESIENVKLSYEEKLENINNANDAEINSIKAEYEGLVDEKESYLEDLLKANNNNKNLESIINELNQRLNRLDVDLKEKNGQIAKLRSENEELMNILDEATN